MIIRNPDFKNIKPVSDHESPVKKSECQSVHYFKKKICISEKMCSNENVEIFFWELDKW